MSTRKNSTARFRFSKNLLIDNPQDTEAQGLLDVVLNAKKAKAALASGESGVDLAEVQAALNAARQLAAKMADAARAAQNAASKINDAKIAAGKQPALRSFRPPATEPPSPADKAAEKSRCRQS